MTPLEKTKIGIDICPTTPSGFSIKKCKDETESSKALNENAQKDIEKDCSKVYNNSRSKKINCNKPYPNKI